MTIVLTSDATEFFFAAGDRGALIGLDLGTKTIGIAVSDPSRMIASPLTTLPRTKFRADCQQLERIIQDRTVVGIVLGLPTNLDGSSGPRVQSTRAYARNLVAALARPVLLWDERLTTVEAERVLIAADASRKRRDEVIDKVAAGLILQSAVDRLRHLTN
ncbi:MAG: Holliday junction resolvase RuvX [Pseudomonadota bacterium]